MLKNEPKQRVWKERCEECSQIYDTNGMEIRISRDNKGNMKREMTSRELNSKGHIKFTTLGEELDSNGSWIAWKEKGTRVMIPTKELSLRAN